MKDDACDAQNTDFIARKGGGVSRRVQGTGDNVKYTRRGRFRSPTQTCGRPPTRTCGKVELSKRETVGYDSLHPPTPLP